MRLPLWAALLTVAISSPALAQPDAETTKKAEKLFQEGRDALAQHDLTVACAKFEESIQLVQAPGTVFNLAQCEEQRGHLLEAIRKWKDGVALVPDSDDRVGPARERVAVLEAKVPQLTVKLPSGLARKDEVRLNDAFVERAALDTPLRLNPGHYVVTLRGSRGGRAEVDLAEGDKKTVDLAPPPAPAMSTRRILGIAIGGVGVAGLAAGAITGVMILGRDGDIDDECPNKACSAKGLDDIDSNKTLITLNWIAFGVGAVATGVGAYLLVTSASDDGAPPATTSVGVTALSGGAGLSLRRQF